MWHTLSSRRRGAAVSLVLVWLAFVSVAFWWFEFRWIREVGILNSEAPGWRQLLPGRGDGHVAVMSFVDPACPCSKSARETLQQVAERFREQGVVFTAMAPGAALPGAITGGPAMMIWDAAGRLAYAGPMALGGHCGGGAERLASMLGDVVKGRQPDIAAIKASCACPWPVARAGGEKTGDLSS